MEMIRNTYKILVEQPQKTDHLKEQGVSTIIILKWTLGKSKLWLRLDSSGLGQEEVVSCCGHGDEHRVT
jgi:hypothetical protein